jgi:hypothetical protein
MANVLTLERFAELSARLASGETRAEALAAASVDEQQWARSQEFWLGRMSEEAGRGRHALAQRYAKLFAAVQRRLREPKKPARRRQWRAMAPARVAHAIPPATAPAAAASSSPPAAAGPASIPAPASTAAPHVARLTVEQLAALRAELVMAPPAEHEVVRSRFGLDEATWQREEAYWQRKLAADEALFQRFLRQFAYCKALLQPRS